MCFFIPWLSSLRKFLLRHFFFFFFFFFNKWLCSSKKYLWRQFSLVVILTISITMKMLMMREKEKFLFSSVRSFSWWSSLFDRCFFLLTNIIFIMTPVMSQSFSGFNLNFISHSINFYFLFFFFVVLIDWRRFIAKIRLSTRFFRWLIEKDSANFFLLFLFSRLSRFFKIITRRRLSSNHLIRIRWVTSRRLEVLTLIFFDSMRFSDKH